MLIIGIKIELVYFYDTTVSFQRERGYLSEVKTLLLLDDYTHFSSKLQIIKRGLQTRNKANDNVRCRSMMTALS